MQVQIKRRFIIAIDEDEAEDFLGNPEALQSKVREQLRANGNGHTPRTFTDGTAAYGALAGKTKATASHPARTKLPKASGKGRRPLRKTPCPECGKELPGHWLVRHRHKVHGVVPTVEIESQE